MSLITYFRRIVAEQPFRVILVVAVSVAAAFLEGIGMALFVPVFQLIDGQDLAQLGRVGRFIMDLFTILGVELTLSSALMLIIIVVALQQGATIIQARIMLGTAFKYEAGLRTKLYRAFLEATWSFFIKHRSGRLTNALTVEATRAKGAFMQYLKLLVSLITIAIYVGLAAVMSWQMALGVIGAGGLVVMILNKQVTRGKRFGQEITQANEEAQSEAIEKLAGVKLIKGCAAEEQAIQKFGSHAHALARSQFRGYLNQAYLRSSYQFMTIVFVCAVIYASVALVDMSMAKLIVFLLIFSRLVPRMSDAQSHQHEYYLQVPALSVIDELFAEASAMREQYSDLPEARFTKKISLENIDFEYVERHPVLAGVELEIPIGKTIAIVGGSGAGKSTIVDLLMGLITPTNGTVAVDGGSLHLHDLHGWRERVGYVGQETILFHDTVAANIGWARPGATQAEIEAAAVTADAHDFIVSDLENGYQTVIGDRGARLSGGQRQRLALARALIRNPEILILDEATSALDAESERKIQGVIESLAGKITIVIVTHRFFTVQAADMIYVLEDGRIIESGLWSQLTAQAGRFTELRDLQKID